MLSLLPMFESERSRVKHDYVCVRQSDFGKSVALLTRVCLSYGVSRETQWIDCSASLSPVKDWKMTLVRAVLLDLQDRAQGL